MQTRRLWLAASVLGSFGCKKTASLPVYATVPSFDLLTQTGDPFRGEQLRGKPWLGSFFFTSCTGPCPRMSTALHSVQEMAYGFKGLRLVSFTADPDNDSPRALADYAKRYKADPERWYFLTGSKDVLTAVSRDGFQAGGLDTERSHSTRVALVDSQMRVRGHYSIETKEDVDVLLSALRAIYEEMGG